VTLGILFLGEVLTTAHIAGMALIFLGLLFIDGRIMRRVFGRVQNNPQPHG
jgi:drug/metabolite transporter (DMT)-like permease